MKNLLVLLFLPLCSSVYAQKTTTELVMDKMRHDKKMLGSFVIMGKMYAVGKVFLADDLYFQCQATLYNHADPLCRLFDTDKLENQYQTVYDTIFGNIEFIQNNNYHKKISLIEKCYNSQKIKKTYRLFVNNPKNFRQDLDMEELDELKKMYLKTGIITINTK